MCGRYVISARWSEVQAAAQPLAFATPNEELEPTYNLAPTQRAWTIRADDACDEAVQMKWGLLPQWAKDAKLAYSTINARLETVAEKPAFRAAWKARRCLIPASGYYEWMKFGPGPKDKQPYYIHHASAPVIFFAGLWEHRADAEAELLTFSIITRDADQTVATLHDRMPLVLPPASFADWLHGGSDDVMGIALAAPPPDLAFHPVSASVGNVRNNDARLIKRSAARD